MTGMVPEVSVLLSAFNGSAYLSEQLDSLVCQTYRQLTIHVRDDGSTDGTGPILERYAAKYPNIHLHSGERLGISASFFCLLQGSGEDSEYFAFCDQDDVWYADKIERAVSKLSAVQPGVPALYTSELEFVNEELAHLGYSRLPRRELLFQNALVENCATGCTVVLNRAARDMIVNRLPGNHVMHDWWCYLVVAAFGVVIYDGSATLKYRLHGGNDTGAAVSFSDNMARRARRFWANRCDAFRIHAQAQEFASIYADRLSHDRRQRLARFLASKRSLTARIRYALNPGVYRQSRLDNVLLRALIVLGWY